MEYRFLILVALGQDTHTMTYPRTIRAQKTSNMMQRSLCEDGLGTKRIKKYKHMKIRGCSRDTSMCLVTEWFKIWFIYLKLRLSTVLY